MMESGIFLLFSLGVLTVVNSEFFPEHTLLHQMYDISILYQSWSQKALRHPSGRHEEKEDEMVMMRRDGFQHRVNHSETGAQDGGTNRTGR